MSKLTEFNEKWILQFESGRTWVNKLPSPETRRAFIRNLKRYCESVNKNPDELIAYKIEGLQNVATQKEFQAERLLEDYFTKCALTDSPKEMLKNAVISFYKHNWRNLNSNVASNIEKPEPKQRCPKMQDIEDLDNSMTSQRDKALLWFFESTSIRVGSIPKLTRKDLKPTNDPEVPFYLLIEAERLKGAGHGKYKGLKQITFVHSLAFEKLLNCEVEAKRKGYVLNDDSPLFIAYNQKGKVKPLGVPAINVVFNEASLTAWHDLEVKRFSPQDFRDFVQSSLESSGVNPNIISPVMAHKIKGIDKHYSTHEILEHKEKYKTALPYLLPQSVEKLKVEQVKQNEEQEKRIAYLEGLLQQNKIQFTETIGEMRADLTDFRVELARTQKELGVKSKPFVFGKRHETEKKEGN
jgi:hypothetical protein